MNKLSLIIFSLALVIGLPVQADISELTATIDKNPALVSESIVLTVVANDNVEQNKLKTDKLLKDFVVGRTNVSHQTSMVNFDMTRTTTWQTILIPRQPGNYVIPAFEIDGVTSQPINVHVLPESQATQRQHQDVYITTAIDRKSLYLQQQATYTVKLHIAKDLQRGSLTEPKLEQATIRQVGKDKEYSELVNGKRYRIIERNFAIQPQKSGTFSIEGPIFQGEVVTRSRGSNMFSMFNETKPVSRLSPKLEIEVLPVPAGYKGNWLPSEYVTLTEEWQPQQTEYMIGEPITRTITLTALGVSEEQLPEIEADYPSQVKVYPDKSDTATVERDNQLIAQRVDSFAIVPSKVGPAKLPAIEVSWFNSKTGKQEIARLPERRITILADPNQQPVQQLPVTQPALPDVQADKPETVVKIQTAPFWIWLAIGLATSWLLTLVGWFIHVRQLGKKNTKAETSDDTNIALGEAAVWKQLQTALKKGHTESVQQLLLAWLICHYQTDWLNLQQALASISNVALSEEVSNLQKHLYSTSSVAWRGEILLEELKQLRGYKPRKKHLESLKGLYPG